MPYFGARINCGTHAKTSLLLFVQNDSVQEERLACAVLTSNSYYSNLFLDPLKKSDCFFAYFETYLDDIQHFTFFRVISN